MHWTYEDPPNAEQLCQGDLLRRTPELERLLEEIHPFYQRKADNRFFLVLTQSCDLVVRDGRPCKTPYITVAAVRPMHVAIERELRSLQRTEIERSLRFGEAIRKVNFDRFIEQLLNNNELTYFYLRREPSSELTEDHCAFLKLSIPLKAEHYKTLLDAKVLQLTDSFQHKLGHIVGNLYSRVGTRDWSDHCTREEYEGLMKEPLQGEREFIWLDKTTHRRVLAGLDKLPAEERTPEKLEELIRAVGKVRDEKRAEVLAAVDDALRGLEIGDHLVEKARKRLQNDPRFTAGIR